MVDATKACESEYVSPDLVGKSKSKKVVFINSGAYVTGKYGEQLQFIVEIDGKQKKWSPNRDTCQNMSKAYGMDTQGWVGKAMQVTLKQLPTGKLAIIGIPLRDEGAPNPSPFVKDVEIT